MFESRSKVASTLSAVSVAALGLALMAGSSNPVVAQFVEPDVETLYLLEGDQNGDNFGWVGGSIGDLNGDSVAEIVVPAISRDGGAGAVNVYSGSDGTLLHQLFGVVGELLGYSVSNAGDVDGDGVEDYIVGGGRVLVISGATHVELMDLTATTGFGHAVGGPGDLNDDGFDDLIVGSQLADDAAGTVFVISGADGALLWSRTGASPGELFGSAVGGLGDVTEDGVADVVVGAFGGGSNGGGVAYVLDGTDGSTVHWLQPEDPFSASVFGQFFASGAGDVDGDGVGDVFVGDYNEGLGPEIGTGRGYIFSGRNGRRLLTFDGLEVGEGLGPGRGIPDVNGDGHADVVIAGYTNSEGASFAGKAYLFSGRSGALLRTMTATLEGDNFGVDALSVGDVNGDGKADFLVTAVGLSFYGLDHGRAYVIAGTDLPCVADLNGDGRVNFADMTKLAGEFGRQGSAGDLNGDDEVDFDDARILLKEVGDCPAGS